MPKKHKGCVQSTGLFSDEWNMKSGWFVLSISFVLSSSAQAQIDPSSALLFNGAKPAAREGTPDSSRYTVRPKAETTVRREEARPPAARRTIVVETKEDSGQPLEPVTVTVPGSDAPLAAPALQPETVVTRVSRQPIVLGAATNQGIIDQRRLNLVELNLSSGYLYTNAESSYFYRRYTSSAPVVGAEADVWLTPNFGLNVSYLGTLSGHVSDSFDGSRSIPATQQWFTAGVRTRKFFGGDALSPTMVFGLDYYEYQFRVPSDSALREKLASIGVRVSLEADVPVTATRSWTLGFMVTPKLQHKETATGVEYQSGGNVEANGVGVSLGARVQFERRDAIFVKLSYIIEKDLFSGDASIPDPLTGVTPSGVAVTTTQSLLQFGYSWGN